MEEKQPYKDQIYSLEHYCDSGIENREESDLKSFLNGLLFNDDFRKLFKVIGTYLKEEYSIDFRFMSVQEQVAAYANIKDVSWFDGFYKLLNEVMKTEKELHIYKPIELNAFKEIELGEQIDHYALPDGNVVKQGSIIKLMDRIGDDYKDTRHYDITNKTPSWILFYPSEKDFEYVHFFLAEKKDWKLGPATYGRARRILSGSTIKILEIRQTNDVVFAYTNNLRINLEAAFSNKEIELVSLKEEESTLATDVLDSLNERIEIERIGIGAVGVELETITEVVNNWGISYLNVMGKEWQNYHRAITGIWYPTTK